ncbi:MAG: phosphatidate cytidylyltransferase, partial [Bacteroidetes bacterium]|nr:phosphatidate cytidylyltransferase [Bacteroidota bacterium]
MASKFSNLAPRVAVAVIGIPFILYASYAGGVLFLLFVLGVGLLALREFLTMAEAKGARPQKALAMTGLA